MEPLVVIPIKLKYQKKKHFFRNLLTCLRLFRGFETKLFAKFLRKLLNKLFENSWGTLEGENLGEASV